ncbi:MAG: DUF59 domain-containing protein [Deltaproteobacteria bacterium]|nr:DUF59 domain-containing protein [Deltaproteobacteria bacterium]MBW2070651.1 DUF59 domain-containing protein [Deltaproteobacteria bacterium]
MDLKKQVERSLGAVIDPETGMDVIRMKLVRDLEVDDDGNVSLTFRPSSVVCPLGFQLAINIQQAVKSVAGVKRVQVNVDGFVHAAQLKKILADLN